LQSSFAGKVVEVEVCATTLVRPTLRLLLVVGLFEVSSRRRSALLAGLEGSDGDDHARLGDGLLELVNATTVRACASELRFDVIEP
jgi:hypothetical protein